MRQYSRKSWLGFTRLRLKIPLLSAALILPMSLTLAGCATDQLALPNEAKPVVRLSVACERLASRVAVPVLQVGDDAKSKMFEHRAALGSANAHLDATRECQRRQRNRFAKG